MTNFLIAEIAIENTAYHFDKLYSYLIPYPMAQNIHEGCRVMVSFGNSVRQGIIFNIHEADNADSLKSIKKQIDKTPVLSHELLQLAQFMKERYFCTLYEACNAMLPPGLSVKISYNLSVTELAADKSNNGTLLPIEQNIIAYIISKKKPVRSDLLCKAIGLEDDSVLRKMAKKGLLVKTDIIQKRHNEPTVKMLQLTELFDENIPLSPKQAEVVNILLMSGAVSQKEVCYFTGVTASVTDALVKKGICCYYEEEVSEEKKKNEESSVQNKEEIILTDEQNRAYTSLLQKYQIQKPFVSLLYGVTGSGKTSVFMKLIDKVNSENKGVICMVPEIALTPQLISSFQSRYGNKIAIFHSGLSLSKRLEEWKRVKSGEATIAIGTRSAIFAPLENIGLIVMDEEQEYTYKSSSSPRFHARELAKFRCRENNCLLLLSSATPSVESFYFAQNGRYGLETLNTRYGKAKLPNVITVDMNIENAQGNMSGYSTVLVEELRANLYAGKQSIILLNRRGHNTFIACRSCNEVISCPNCSISLTYHSANKRLMCHYCGYSTPVPSECPSCHSNKLRYAGMGTQRAEQELSEIFPEARLLRLDTDAVMRRFSYEQKLSAFRNGEYDIMLGTQMVAKGLDFPNVTLVGVLSADNMMHSDDFRSYERTFSLLTQVVGRSGRGDYEGRALIQTYEPENPIISLAAMQNYSGFFNNEIPIRKAMLYPPFTDICVLAFMGREQIQTAKTADAFLQSFSMLAHQDYPDLPLRVLGPAPALVSRLNNKYRYRIIIKFRSCKAFRELMSKMMTEFGKKREYSGISVYADINPDTIL